MTTLGTKPLATKLTFDSDCMWVDLADGRQLSVPLAYFPRLFRADMAHLENYIISGGGTGLHWEELDEDISVDALLLGIWDRTGFKPASETSPQRMNETPPPGSKAENLDQFSGIQANNVTSTS
ncbi:MAG: DUF2442 domain-containing protein [Deltaproteobacteria bacterium]|nr:DUF2442 domain-containing protein [Deltaproteobacteria bacterium]